MHKIYVQIGTIIVHLYIYYCYYNHSTIIYCYSKNFIIVSLKYCNSQSSKTWVCKLLNVIFKLMLWPSRDCYLLYSLVKRLKPYLYFAGWPKVSSKVVEFSAVNEFQSSEFRELLLQAARVHAGSRAIMDP